MSRFLECLQYDFASGFIRRLIRAGACARHIESPKIIIIKKSSIIANGVYSHEAAHHEPPHLDLQMLVL